MDFRYKNNNESKLLINHYINTDHSNYFKTDINDNKNSKENALLKIAIGVNKVNQFDLFLVIIVINQLLVVKFLV